MNVSYRPVPGPNSNDLLRIKIITNNNDFTVYCDLLCVFADVIRCCFISSLEVSVFYFIFEVNCSYWRTFMFYKEMFVSCSLNILSEFSFANSGSCPW